MQEKSIIKKNILQFLEYKGISKYKFYQNTGITRGILDQNNGMSEDNTVRFLAYYSEINPEWLLTGKGNMLKKDYSNSAIIEEYKKNLKNGPDYEERIIITNDDRDTAKDDTETYLEKLRNRPDYEDRIIISNYADDITISSIKKENKHLEDKVRMQETIIDFLKKEVDFLKDENNFLRSKSDKIEK